MLSEIEGLLERQRTVAIQLKEIKVVESALRDKICNHYFEQGYTETGTSVLVDGPYDITIARKLNVSLDLDILEEIMPDLSIDEKACIHLKPELFTGVYKKLVQIGKNAEPPYHTTMILDQAIIIKDAKPTLEISLHEE